MKDFTNAQMSQMHLIYGLANGNAEEARQRYPNTVLPCVKLFRRLHSRLTEAGKFAYTTDLPGRPATMTTPQSQEVILRMIEEDPSTRTRKIGWQLHVSAKTVKNSPTGFIKRNVKLKISFLRLIEAIFPRGLFAWAVE